MDYCRDKTHQSHWCLLLAIAGGRLGSSSKMNSVSLKGESVRVGERSILVPKSICRSFVLLQWPLE
jgi:hypothetical protein